MNLPTSLSPLRLAACVMCTVAIAAIANPAEARPRHHGERHHVSHHHSHKHHHAGRHHVRRARHGARWNAFRQQAQQFGDSNASMDSSGGFGSGFGGSNVVSEARRYLGGNPTGRSRLWCARFMNMVLQKTGHKGTGSDMASSFARYGNRISGPQVGAIAVMGRRGGGHVGVVSGIDAKGNPIIISGNHGHRVAESTYSRGRIYAYVMPSS
jgi:uncharacterized protein (TIGR02594 family)